jgi:hypothetical protein
VIHEAVEVQEKDVFNKESIPTGNRLNVVFECEEGSGGRWNCNGMILASDEKAGLRVQVDWRGVGWQRKHCHAGLWMEESVALAAVAFLAMAFEGVEGAGDIQGLGTGGEEGGPFRAKPARVRRPCAKGLSESQILCPELHTSATAGKESSGKETAPYLEAGLVWCGLIGPQ